MRRGQNMYSMKNAILDMKITLDTMESRALDQDDITKIDAMINFLDHYQRIINITKDTTFSKEIEIIRRKAENYLNMNQTLYLDESGKTGSMRLVNGKNWNFSNQPYFVLCGILIKDASVSQLDKFINEIRTKYKIQGEMKSTNKTIKKNKEKLIQLFMQKQNELGCKLYIEVVNKRYCIATKIVDYCVCPYYDSPISLSEFHTQREKIVKMTLANYIYDVIPDELLGEYAEFFDNDVKDLDKFLQLNNRLLSFVTNPIVSDYVRETIDTIQQHEKLHIPAHNLFPLVDTYRNETSTVAISPQIDCLNNILSKCPNTLHIIHDNICDLETALEKTAKYYFPKASTDYMEFADSKKTNILQLCDFWCGIINNTVQEILSKNNEIDVLNNSEVLRQLIETQINYVGTFKEQSILFSNDDINQLLKCYQDII